MGSWLYNLLISIDQLGNALLGGDPDETISSRLGKLKRRHGGTIPWSRPASKVIDRVLDWIEPNHSTLSIEENEGDDALVDKD